MDEKLIVDESAAEPDDGDVEEVGKWESPMKDSPAWTRQPRGMGRRSADAEKCDDAGDDKIGR